MAGVGITRVSDCPICLGTFKDPRVLPCGHTFCLICIKGYGRSKGSDPDCPNCRAKFHIPPDGFAGLPKNYSLNSVLCENVVGTTKPKVAKGLCKKHRDEQLVLYCVQCSLVICLDCMEEDHPKHNCCKISRFAKEARTQLESYVKSIQPILSQVTSQKAQLQEKSKKFCDLLDETELAINEECEKKKRLLDDHKRLLLEELSNKKQKVTKYLKMKTDEVETEQLRLASFNTRIEELLQGADEATTFDMAFQYKDFKESFEKLKQMQPPAMGQYSTRDIRFIPGDLTDFISRRENAIGRLEMESDSKPEIERNKLVSKITMEENKDTKKQGKHISDSCDAVERRKRIRVLRNDVTPSVKQVDLSLSRKVPIDQHVWYYLECKHPNRVNEIATKHFCISWFVCKSSNEGITHSLEVVPFYREKPDEAKKYVEDAVEEFAQLYQKVSGPGIVKENIKLPLPLNKGIPQQLIAELEEAGVFFLRSDDEPCLVGPKACIEEAKQKLSDFISRHSNSPTLTQPNDNIGQAQASAEDRVGSFTFTTPSGLTVHVSKGDLVHQELDAIVNPANERLGNGGGAARAIAKAAGYNFQRECDEKIRKNGELDIACVTHTSAGNLRPRIKYVIHTVGPKNTDTEDDEQLLALVRLAVFNCISYANGDLKVHSLAIPAISSGIFGVPIEIVGRASYEALIKFDEYCASTKNNTVREIYFLNKDEPTFSNMKRIFQSLMKDFQESSFDPENLCSVMEYFYGYVKAHDRQIIETEPHDNCFTRAFAIALERDFHSKFDWRKVEDMIKKELENNKDYYKVLHASEESPKQWSFADVVKHPWRAIDAVANFLSAENKDVDLDVWIDAAANALNVQIVLVQLSETQLLVERNVKPRSSKDDRTVYIAYHYCGHHHFDALVKMSSSEDTVSVKEVKISVEDTSAGTNNNSSASCVTGLKAAKADDAKNDDDNNHCLICMDDITDKKELPCKHKFCRECIDEYFSKGQPKCPSCGKVFGTLRGDQPKGTMTWKVNTWQNLPGYNDCGIIEIDYSFNDGRQGDSHLNPGQPYRGTHRTAYLPANKEGREVLRLLKRAFDAGLVFTIGLCSTTGRDNVVIWKDIHHKTSPSGQYGYPDPTYLKRVREELAAKGIK